MLLTGSIYLSAQPFPVVRPVIFDTDEFAEILAGQEEVRILYSEREALSLVADGEKLSRELFNAFYAKWNEPVFSEAEKSGQNRLDLINVFMERFPAAGSAGIYENGKFKSPDNQLLYDNLLVKGSRSCEEALEASMFTQELAIYDIRFLIRQTSNSALRLLYLNIEKGARSVIWMLARELDKKGRSYNPLFLEKDFYNKIIGSAAEKKSLIKTPWFWFSE